MSKATMRWWRRLRASGKMPLHKHQQGQSLIIIVFAFIGILAFVGLAIDLATVYTERVKVSRAADAAALAAASELPFEPAAHERALVYLQENGYDYTASDAAYTFDTYVGGQYGSDPGGFTTIWIDTVYSRDTSLPGPQQASSADRIRVRVRRQVFMTFMQFVGFNYLSVEATAEAENISNIDTVIVYDKSGSMEFDTLCYGCWEPVAGQMYPDGELYPLHWSDTTIASADHCAGWSEAGGYNCGSYQVYNSSYERNNCNWHHRSYDNRYYIVIEAEEYSLLNVSASDWGYAPYYTFWVIQRNEYNDSQSDWVGAQGRDARGAYLGHHPYRNYQYSTGLGVACTWSDLTNGGFCRSGITLEGRTIPPFLAPRADYEFYAPSDAEGGNHDDYYVWIRGQGGSSGSDRHIFWGIDGSPYGQENYFPQGPGYDGADEDLWDWRCLGRVDNLYQGTHTLNLWAGGAGFDVDRIVIQTRDDGSCSNDSSPPDSPDTYPANNGRTNWACHPCDPRFAGRPGGQSGPNYRPDCNIGGNPDQRGNPIYDDEQPIRNALEAAKYFVSLLDPRFDQVGYVRYSTNSEIANELECTRRLGVNCTEQVINNTVIAELDATSAGGNTDIAGGILDGIEVLSTDAGHYGRP
ncbi:MAG: hypothetical protein KKC18_04840, partial [Chloroflexi bacterium]|nr:hypothetical protein [Chloroflexota bacterium]